jgi:hypothetical protein
MSKSRRQPAKFCTIAKYLELNEPEMYQILDQSCLVPLLTKKVTFLVPPKKQISEIDDMLMDASTYDAGKEILLSLVLNDVYNSPEDFGDQVVNKLRFELPVSRKGDAVTINGWKLSQISEYVPTSRTPSALYRLSGSGELPLAAGQKIDMKERNRKQRERAKEVLGGSSSNAYREIQNILVDNYAKLLSGTSYSQDNIYVAKVMCQLNLLKRRGLSAQSDEIRNHLGNDEFSDALLLDKLCNKSNLDGCYNDLLACLQAYLANPQSYDFSYAKYCQLKGEFTNGPHANDQVDRSRIEPPRLCIALPEDIKKVYRSARNENMARDLFIVLCNIKRIEWQNSPDRVDYFRAAMGNLSSLDLEGCVNSKMITYIVTAYGYLSASDIILYEPQACFMDERKVSWAESVQGLPDPSSLTEGHRIPLSYLIRKVVRVGGYHNPNVNSVLAQYKK